MIKNILKKVPLLLIGGVIIGLVLSYTSYETVSRTGTASFCASCHEMAPMRASFDQDVHGGNGKTGIKAHCVDCHLPQDNMVNYIFTKAKNGISEVNTHFFGDVDAIDWHKKREERTSFVYDNGCKKCHTNYDTNKKFNPKALQMHKHYKSLIGTDKQLGCASCHAEVGHKGLNNMLNVYQPKHFLYEVESAKEKVEINQKLYGTDN